MFPASSRRIVAASIAALAAAACGASNDRHFHVDTFPQGARVSVGEEGHVEGQSPIDSLHVVIPDDGTVLFVIEKDGYQTVAVPISAEAPDRLFFCLQRAPDLDKLLSMLQGMKASIDSVNALAADIKRQLQGAQK